MKEIIQTRLDLMLDESIKAGTPATFFMARNEDIERIRTILREGVEETDIEKSKGSSKGVPVLTFRTRPFVGSADNEEGAKLAAFLGINVQLDKGYVAAILMHEFKVKYMKISKVLDD